MVKGDPVFFILKPAAWLDPVKFENRILGAVITKPADPGGGSRTPEEPQDFYEDADLIENPLGKFVAEVQQKSSAGFGAMIKSLGGIQLRGSQNNMVALDGKMLRIKRLQQQSELWGRLREDEEVEPHLHNWVSHRSSDTAFFVVGIMICEDVQTTYIDGRSREVAVQLSEPVSTATSSGACPNAQVSVTGQWESESTLLSSIAPPRICAVELQRITKPIFQSMRKAAFSVKPV